MQQFSLRNLWKFENLGDFYVFRQKKLKFRRNFTKIGDFWIKPPKMNEILKIELQNFKNV